MKRSKENARFSASASWPNWPKKFELPGLAVETPLAVGKALPSTKVSLVSVIARNVCWPKIG